MIIISIFAPLVLKNNIKDTDEKFEKTVCDAPAVGICRGNCLCSALSKGQRSCHTKVMNVIFI